MTPPSVRIAVAAALAAVAVAAPAAAGAAPTGPRATATIGLTSSTVAPGSTDTVKLLTTGATVGRIAKLQEQSGASWVTQGTVKVPSSHRTSLKVSYASPGVHLLRWRLPSVGRRTAITTKVARVTVLWPTTPLWTSASVLSSSGGYGPATDQAAEVNGVRYSHALTWSYHGCSACAPSATTWNLGRAWRSFHAVLGVDDSGRSGSTYEAEFFGDGRPLYRQVIGFASTTPVDLDVTGIVHLTYAIAPGNSTVPVLAQPFASGEPSGHPSAHTAPVVTFVTEQDSVANTGGYGPTAGYGYMGGVRYARSLSWDYQGCNACSESTLDYNLGRAYDHLTGFVGVDDGGTDHSNATITFVVDGAAVGTITAAQGSAKPFDINVAGGLRLQLQVTVAGRTTPIVGDIRLLAGRDMAPSNASTTPQYS